MAYQTGSRSARKGSMVRDGRQPTAVPVTIAEADELTSAPIADPGYDVRQPLAAIATLADAALSEVVDPQARADALRRIADISRSLLELCRSVRRRNRPEPITVATVAAPVVAERAAATGCSVVLDARRTAVVADAAALRVALWTLIDSACAAAGSHGIVRVEARRDGPCVAIEVTDSGPRVGGEPPSSPAVGLAVFAHLARREGWQLEVIPGAISGATVRLLIPSSTPDEVIAGVVVCGEPQSGGEALAAALEQRCVEVLAVEHDLRRCIDAIRTHQPAFCVVTDSIAEPDVESLLAQLRQIAAATRVILVGSHRPARISRSAVVAECIPTDAGAEQVAAAVERCAYEHLTDRPAAPEDRRGGADGGLTPREHEVLERLVRGMNTAALAWDLGITYTTARAHIQKVLTKLGVHSKLEAVAFAIREGIVPPPVR